VIWLLSTKTGIAGGILFLAVIVTLIVANVRDAREFLGGNDRKGDLDP